MASGAGVLIFVPTVSFMHNFYAQFLCNIMEIPHVQLPRPSLSTSFFSTYFSQLHLPKTTNLPLRDIISLPLPVYVILMQAKATSY